MKTWHYIIIGIALLIVIAGGTLWWRNHAYTVPAQVIYGAGEVLVNGEAISASQELKQGDVVATKKGSATMILQESAFVNLAPNTTVKLTSLDEVNPKVEQLEGKSGIVLVHATTVEQFDVTQGDALLQVKGTFLSLDQVRMLVGSGYVHMTLGDNKLIVSKKFTLYYNSVTKQSNAQFNRDGEVVVEYTPEEKLLMAESVRAAITALRLQRLAEIEKYPDVLSLVESQAKMSKGQLLAELERYDAKTAQDVDDAVARSPISHAGIVKVAAYTKEIQLMNAYLAELEG